MADTTSSLRSPSDAELITSARAGDDDAYAELYRRHDIAARSAARSLTRSRSDVDDLVAEAFVRVLQALRVGKGPEVAFRPYLVTAVRNAFYDRTRRDKRLEVTAEPPEHINVQLLDMANSEGDRDLVARAFATLPERWQLVLWHTEVEGRSASEVGESLGLASNAVAALAYRAREGLRQAYLQAHLQRTVPERCAESRSQLGGYVRNTLAIRDRRKVDEHLDHCHECSRLLAELGDANRNLRAVLIPILLGVPAAQYLAGLGGGSGLAGLFRRLPRSAQTGTGFGVAVAATAVAAAAAVAVTVVSLAGGGGHSSTELALASSVPAIIGNGSADSGRPVESASDDSGFPPTIASDVIRTSSTAVPALDSAGSEQAALEAGGALALAPGSSVASGVPSAQVPRPTTSNSTGTSSVAPRLTTVAQRPLTVPPTAATTVPSATTSSPPTTATATSSSTAPTTTASPTTAPPATVAPTTIVEVAVVLPLFASVSTDLPLIAGQYATLTISVSNPARAAGVIPNTARAPRVTMAIPAGTELAAAVDAPWSCAVSGHTLECDGVAAIASQQTVSLDIELRLRTGLSGEIVFQPRVSAAGFEDRSSPTTLTVGDGAHVEYFREIRGGIAATGNSSMVCVDDRQCESARLGTASGPNNRRNSHLMGYVDIDTTSSFNSSSSELSLPAGASVERAVLIWSGETSGGTGGLEAPDPDRRDRVQLSGPGGARTVVAADLDDDGTSYVARADVTDLVVDSGWFTVANIQAGTGTGRFAGWALMVVYRDAGLPLSLVSLTAEPGPGRAVFGGEAHRIPLGPIPTASEPRSGTLAWAVFEGDRSITNESVTVNGVALAGADADDLFDSSVAVSRSPADPNSFGLDIDHFDLSIVGAADALELSIISPNDRLRWGIVGWTVIR